MKIKYHRYLLLLLLVLLVLQALAQNRTDSIRQKIRSRDTNSVLVVAHRADWRYGSENSLLAIENAINIGVDVIEIDIQRTSDGHLVLMHDETLDRTTTGKGRVDSVSLDSIQKLKLRNGIGIPTREHIPTLEEVLLMTKNKVMLNLDKADRYIDDVYALLRKTGTQNMVIMKTSRPFVDTRVQFHEHLFESILMPIIDLDLPYAESEFEAYMSFLKPDIIEFTYKDSTNPLPLLMRRRTENKVFLWYNTMWGALSGGLDDDKALADPESVYGYLIDSLGATIIQTDRPEYLLNFLRRKGLHD